MCKQALLDACRRSNDEKDQKIHWCESEIAKHLRTIEEANCKIRQDETLRRKLHNTILELKVTAITYKGNFIKVKFVLIIMNLTLCHS